jgi:hypothetical protein
MLNEKKFKATSLFYDLNLNMLEKSVIFQANTTYHLSEFVYDISKKILTNP